MVNVVYVEKELLAGSAGPSSPLLKLWADCELLSRPVLHADRLVHRLQWIPLNIAEINKDKILSILAASPVRSSSQSTVIISAVFIMFASFPVRVLTSGPSSPFYRVHVPVIL